MMASVPTYLPSISSTKVSGQNIRNLHQGQSATRAASAVAQLKRLSDGDSESLAQKLRTISGPQNVSLAEAVRLENVFVLI